MSTTATLAPAARPSFDRLAALEPGLGRLMDEVRALRRDPPPAFCAMDTFFGYSTRGDGLKRRLSRLAGWQAANPELISSDAYDVAYHAVLNALPACAAGCMCGAGGRAEAS